MMWRRPKPEPAEEPKATRRGEDCDATRLAEECDAFLAGGYRHYLEVRDEPIPAWAWVNCLAHGDRADIESVAATQTNDAGPDALIAEIAVSALARLAGGAMLEVLQRNTLVPLELALAARPGLAPTSSLELGRALASALPKRLSPPVAPRRPDR